MKLKNNFLKFEDRMMNIKKITEKTNLLSKELI